MDAETKRAVRLLAVEMVGNISEAADDNRRGVYDTPTDKNVIATLEVARQLSRLTAEVRAMVSMQAEAMAMAREMIEKFKAANS